MAETSVDTSTARDKNGAPLGHGDSTEIISHVNVAGATHSILIPAGATHVSIQSSVETYYTLGASGVAIDKTAEGNIGRIDANGLVPGIPCAKFANGGSVLFDSVAGDNLAHVACIFEGTNLQ